MSSQTQVGFRLPRPGKATLVLMIGIACLWVIFALGINWVGAGTSLYQALIGDTAGVFSGEVWRLATAPLMHHPKLPSHALFVCLMLYFFATPLEDRWGRKRLLLFLFGSATFAYVVQMLIGLAIPQLDRGEWFGGMVMADAATVAWAIVHRGHTVRLFFVLPMRPMVMVWILVAWTILNNLIALNPDPEGVVAPFAALGAGWLFGDTSPLRRLWLKLRLRRLQAEVASLKRPGPRPSNEAGLRVIRGGRDDDDERMVH